MPVAPSPNLFRISLVAILMTAVTGCDLGPTEAPVDALDSSDYALALFGPEGIALETALGTQTDRPFDGRTKGLARLPEALRLTQAQLDEIAALRAAFRTEQRVSLEALRAALERARAARLAGQPREEMRAIMMEALPVARSLRPAVMALHRAIWEVLTPEQRAWLETNRPRKAPLIG